MLLNDQEIVALRSTFLLHHIPSAEFIRFANAKQPEFLRCHCAKGEAVHMPEGQEHHLCVLISGELRGVLGSKLPDRIMEPGFVIGALDLFSRAEPALPPIFASEDSELLFISAAQMETLFRRYPEIMQRYIYFLTGQLQLLRQEKQVFSAESTEGRLLRFLEANGTRTETGGRELTLAYSYAVLASQLGISRATLYRVFDNLERAGTLVREGKTIRLIAGAEPRNFL